MREKMKPCCIKFSEEDLRQLDCLVESAKRINADIAFGMAFNRSTVLRNLISVNYVKVMEEQREFEEKVARAKRRAKPKTKKKAG